ncbi:hypothetical protein DY000_02016182 [Brassica cretica]|uniref:Uncharacterized protein n=1 Tax=Brassica cretica TaxID=69181 RepID=A0ABQ7DD91_BRACR|nr:hypothetical protein DY000_02016182 [Brassica cretica]
MDPNQTIGTTPSGIDNVDPPGSNSRTETLPVGPTGTDGTTGTTHTQQIPPIGTSTHERSSAQDRSSPPVRTSVPERTSIPDRTEARVWNRPREKRPLTTKPDLNRRPIFPTPLAQTLEEMTELRGMVSSLIDEARNQKAAYRDIANRLDQAEQELAEYRANARERNQPLPDPLRETLNPQNAGAFGTPEISSARSGRYTGENMQRPPQQSMPPQSLSYNGLDEIDTGLQAQRSTPIQSQNIYMERTGEPRNRIPPLGN